MEENIQIVEKLILSQEGQPQTHKSLRQIEMDTGIPKSTVNQIVKRDLHLKPVITNCTVLLAASNFYNDLQVENWQKPRNSHDDCVFVPADHAKKHVERSGFPKKFMVSGVSNLGKTSLHFIEEGVKMNRYYYINEVVAKMLPETHALSDGDFIFQQDGPKCHTAHVTIA